MEVLSRFFTPPKSSFFFFGPRGTGKSTFVRQYFPKALYIDLLDPERVRLLSARPERLQEIIAAQPEKTVVVLDEIQKIPELLSVVHSLIEAQKDHCFVLTGSSSRKLKRTGVDLLGGRALVKTLHPFMASELEDLFALGRALQYGLLPVVLNSPDPGEVLRSYAALYLREEVQMEGLVRNIGNFSRFLEAVSFSHASLLNVSNVARECEVERKVVEGYLGILEDILLGWRAPVFTRRAQRQLSKHPKFYFFDAGVFRSLRPQGPLDRPEELEGQALEGLVAQHLKAWCSYSGDQAKCYFWRTRSGVEVDFVVYGPQVFWAFEVKNSRTVHPADLHGLRAFREEYPASRVALLYRGKDQLLKDGIPCWPCRDFLTRLHPAKAMEDVVSNQDD